MKNSWKVKYSGKVDILLFSYIVIFLVFAYFILRGTLKEGGDFMENVGLSALIIFPIIFAATTVPLSMLRKKLIPKSIVIDMPSNNVNITFFSNHRPYQIAFEDLSYHKIETTYFTVLVFNNKEIATRGHTLHFELFSIIALHISTSWKKKQVYEIVNRFKELNIDEYTPSKPKPIVDYLLG